MTADAAPLAGAAIATSPLTTPVVSGDNGRFRIASVPVGIYRVTATRQGYEPLTLDDVSVVADRTTELSLRLERRLRGFIRGIVRFSDGTPAPYVAVSTDRHGARTATGADGRYELEVPSTTYTVLAAPLTESYESAVANLVFVPAAGEVTADLTLHPRALGSAAFIGSSACAECHAGHYGRWASTLHNNTIRYVDDPVPSLGGAVISSWTGTITLARAPGVNYQVEFAEAAGQYTATLIDSSGARRAFPIVRTHGGGSGWKQRYQVRIGGLFYTLPIQWNEVPRAWVTYNPQYWFNADGTGRSPDLANSFEQNCLGCHATGYKVAHDADNVAVSVRYTETNIGCEACHGPGSTHAQTRNASDIFNPRRLLTQTAGVFDGNGNLLDPEANERFLRANETCGQCHHRVESNAAADYQSAFAPGTHEYPFLHARGDDGAYRVGEPLSWYARDKSGRWGDTRYDVVDSSKQHHQQWADILEATKKPSSHGKNARRLVACFDCHNPHGSGIAPQLRQSSKDNTLCLSCHGGYGPFAPAPGQTVDDAAKAHTRHFVYSPGVNGSGRCTGCHMPRTAKSAIDRDIASHTFAIIVPHESRDMKAAGKAPVPNTCDNCHRNDSDLGVLRYEFMFGAPSPVSP